jgi:curved DNA-binding protein CbpA
MTTLYDLLGVRPDDDSGALKNAFREAAKANHPDLNPGDPDASMRFGRIVRAYAILRDAEKRAAYDQLLELERARQLAELEGEQLRWKSRSTITYTMNKFVFRVVVVTGLAIVLPGGYTLLPRISKTSLEPVKADEVTASGPTKTIVVHDMTGQDERADSGGVQAAHGTIVPSDEGPVTTDAVGVTRIADGGRPSSAESEPEVDDSLDLTFGALPDERANTDDLRRKDGFQQLDQNGAPSPVNHRSSFLERDNGVSKSLSSDITISDENYYLKTPDIKRSDIKRSDINIETPDIKRFNIKTPARSWKAAKRRAASRTSFEQVSLAHDCILSGGLVCAFPSSPNLPQRKRR